MRVNKIQLFCKRCGKRFWLWPSQMKKGGGKFCSLECKRPKKVRRICPRCNKDFWVSPSIVKARKYCSFKCKYPKRIRKICQTCNKEFWVSPNKLRNGFSKYCCFKCYGLSMVGKMGKESPGYEGGKIEKLCKACGNKYYVHLSRSTIRESCSRKCGAKIASENRKGENCNFWRGGITPLHSAIRYCLEGRKWIKDVLIRDNYTCCECNIRGSYLEAHHIKNFSILLRDFLDKYSQFSPIEDKETLFRLAITHEPFWDLTNGKTLCLECHIKTRKEIKKEVTNGESREN